MEEIATAGASGKKKTRCASGAKRNTLNQVKSYAVTVMLACISTVGIVTRSKRIRPAIAPSIDNKKAPATETCG